MSRSRKRSFSVPHPLMDALEMQIERGVLDYPSANAAVTGLILYQGLVGKEHTVTSAFAYMHPSHQDAVHDFVLELNTRGISLMGSFLRKVAERVAADMAEPDPDRIVKLTAAQILDWSMRWQGGDVTVWIEIGDVGGTKDGGAQ